VELRDLAAGDLQFETAGEVQRQVQALRWIAQARLRVAGGGPDMDVWALAGAGAGTAVAVLEVRRGRLQECHLRPGADPGAVLADHYRRHGRPAAVLAGPGLGGPCGDPVAGAGADGAAWLASAAANAELAARLLAAGALPV
jgi:hypothetical protein